MKPTKKDWFEVASICGEWIRGQAELNDPIIWNYYRETLGSRVWNLYHKTMLEAAGIIDPIQPFNVTCEKRMFVALQIACEKAGLCR